MISLSQIQTTKRLENPQTLVDYFESISDRNRITDHLIEPIKKCDFLLSRYPKRIRSDILALLKRGAVMSSSQKMEKVAEDHLREFVKLQKQNDTLKKELAELKNNRSLEKRRLELLESTHLFD